MAFFSYMDSWYGRVVMNKRAQLQGVNDVAPPPGARWGMGDGGGGGFEMTLLSESLLWPKNRAAACSSSVRTADISKAV